MCQQTDNETMIEVAEPTHCEEKALCQNHFFESRCIKMVFGAELDSFVC